MPISNKLVKEVAISVAGLLNLGFFGLLNCFSHKATAVLDISSLFLLNLASSLHIHNKRSALQDISANLHGKLFRTLSGKKSALMIVFLKYWLHQQSSPSRFKAGARLAKCKCKHKTP